MRGIHRFRNFLVIHVPDDGPSVGKEAERGFRAFEVQHEAVEPNIPGIFQFFGELSEVDARFRAGHYLDGISPAQAHAVRADRLAQVLVFSARAYSAVGTAFDANMLEGVVPYIYSPVFPRHV